MTRERWNLLMNSPDIRLSEEEMKQGWHWCQEMDGLLANSNEPDGDCFCALNKSQQEPPTSQTNEH